MKVALNIRGMEPATVATIKQLAYARQWTIAKYLTAVTELHQVVRARADAGDHELHLELVALGLETANEEILARLNSVAH